MFANKVFERYNVKKVALRQYTVVKVCPFVLLFFTCSVTYFRRIFVMFNSPASRISDKSLHKCSMLMMSNTFAIKQLNMD